MKQIKIYVYKNNRGLLQEFLNQAHPDYGLELVGIETRNIDEPEEKKERREYFLYAKGALLNEWSIRNCKMHSEMHEEVIHTVEIHEDEKIYRESDLCQNCAKK